MKNVSGDHLRLRFGKEVEAEAHQGSNRKDSFQPVTRTPSLCSLPGVPRATVHSVTPTMASEVDAPRQNLGDSTEEERSESTTPLDTSGSHINVQVQPSSNTETSTENVTACQAPPSVPENGATGNEQVQSPTVSGTSTTEAPATALASPQSNGSRALVVNDGIALPGVVPKLSASHSAIPSVSVPATPFYGFPEERVQQPSSSQNAERPTPPPQCSQMPPVTAPSAVNSPVPPREVPPPDSSSRQNSSALPSEESLKRTCAVPAFCSDASGRRSAPRHKTSIFPSASSQPSSMAINRAARSGEGRGREKSAERSPAMT